MLRFLYSTRIRILVDTGISLFILRTFAAGFMFFGHGFGKVMGLYFGHYQFVDPIGVGPEASFILAALAESVFALFIIFGFLSRLSALVLTVNMAVACTYLYFNQMLGDMEPALLYLLLFTSIFMLGPGKYSVDYYFRKNGIPR